MATRKIEVNEDDLKKVILILKLSKQYVKIPSRNLVLLNMWRVSGKLADKFMRKAGLTMVTNRGRTTLKPIGEVVSEVADKNPSTEEKITSEIPFEKPVGKVPRCSKRKK